MFCPKCGTENPDNGKFCRSCGINLSALTPETNTELKLQEVYIDHRGRVRSNNPDDLWTTGIRFAIMGVGFLIVSIALLITNVAGGHGWWWAMLFPAFSMLAKGVSQIERARRIERKKSQNEFPAAQSAQSFQTPASMSLPFAQTEYVNPESRYKTGDLVPPSVVESTTRHLEMNNEGETMTLPKK